MPWPRGMPRIGHVNKDGTQHAKKGEKLHAVSTVEPVYTQTKKDKPVMLVEKSPTLHGMTGRPIIEPCPNCNYAYADGGYCESCGWTLWKGKGK